MHRTCYKDQGAHDCTHLGGEGAKSDLTKYLKPGVDSQRCPQPRPLETPQSRDAFKCKGHANRLWAKQPDFIPGSFTS